MKEKIDSKIRKFKSKESAVRKKIIGEIALDILILLLLKLPFDLIRDFGYDRSLKLRTDYYDIWNNGIFIVYIIVLIGAFIYFVKYINKKYDL